MKYRVKALNVGDINGKPRYHGELVDGACFYKPDELVADGHLEPVDAEPEGHYPEVDPPMDKTVLSLNGDTEGFTQNGNSVTLGKEIAETPQKEKRGAAGKNKK